MNGSEKIINLKGVGPYFYSVGKKVSYTVRYIVRMTDEIDGDILKQAFETTMQRYPYLRVKYVKGFNSDHLEYNDAPLVVLNTSDALVLGPKTNGHLLAITYYRKSFYLNYSHGLLDGRGKGPFLKTLMYYYCSKRYNENVEMENVQLAGEPIDPMEYEDPYTRHVPTRSIFGKSIFPYFNPRPAKLLKLGLIKESPTVVHCLSIDESAFMAWCKQHDATPNIAITVMMCRAIKRLHPDLKKKITPYICCDLRNALSAPKSHWSLITPLFLNFDRKVAKMDITDQCTVMRGQLLLQSDPEELHKWIRVYKVAFSSISHSPKLIKKMISKRIMGSIEAFSTFAVSYSGKVSYGSCDKYVRGFYPEPNFGNHLMIEVTVTGGKFLLDFAEKCRESVYFDTFRTELEANGIPSEVTYTYDQRTTLLEL